LKVFQKIVPEICDKVEYQGNKIRKGSNLKFHWTKRVKMCVDILVKDVIQHESKTIFKYECSDANNMVPKQDIEWEIIKISEDSCLIIFSHIFKDIIKQQSINQISEEKRKILLNFKTAVEDGKYKSHL